MYCKVHLDFLVVGSDDAYNVETDVDEDNRKGSDSYYYSSIICHV